MRLNTKPDCLIGSAIALGSTRCRLKGYISPFERSALSGELTTTTETLYFPVVCGRCYRVGYAPLSRLILPNSVRRAREGSNERSFGSAGRAYYGL